MRRYVQNPAGWWQDSKNRMQPPGSFLDPSLRVPPGSADMDGLSVTVWARSIVKAVGRRAA